MHHITVNSIAKHHKWLHNIIQDPFNKLQQVKMFQKSIAASITTIEKRKNILKTQKKAIKKEFTKRLDKEHANYLKEVLEEIELRMYHCNYAIISYKFLVDGIILSFFDKFDLKPFYWNGSPGGFSGKKGRRNEWMIFNKGFEKGCLVLMADLTTLIRNFDLILFNKKKEYLPIEVKSSKNENQRDRRQKKRIQALSNYLKTDDYKADNGEILFKRKSAKVSLVDYKGKLNEFFAKNETGFTEFEKGFYFLSDNGKETLQLEKIIPKKNNLLLLTHLYSIGYFLSLCLQCG